MVTTNRACWTALGALLYLLASPFEASSADQHPAELPATLGTGPSGDRQAPASRKKSIVVDGREIFRIGDSGNYSAAERAALVNQRLMDELRRGATSQLQVVEYEGLATIRLGDEHLLSVDAPDMVRGMSSWELAQAWARSLESALDRSREERTAGYLPRAAASGAAVLAVAISLHWILRTARRRAHLWWAGSRGPVSPAATSLVQIVLVATQLVLWFVAAWIVTDRFPRLRQARYQLVESTLRSPIFAVGGQTYSAADALWVGAMVAVLWVCLGALTRVLRARLYDLAGARGGVIEPLSLLLQYGLLFIGLIVILQAGGLDLSSLTFLASILGVGIGFGLQNIANNFISGVIIAFERPIQVGDFVQVGKLLGTVERVGARSTEIQTPDRITIIVPNSRFLEHEVINWSHGDSLCRLHVPVGVAYGSDLAQVQSALLEAAAEHPDLVRDPRPEVELQAFGDSALELELEVWTRKPRAQRRIMSSLNFRIEASLRRHGIVVPFPQRTLHLAAEEVRSIVAGRSDAHPVECAVSPSRGPDRLPPTLP